MDTFYCILAHWEPISAGLGLSDFQGGEKICIPSFVEENCCKTATSLPVHTFGQSNLQGLSPWDPWPKHTRGIHSPSPCLPLHTQLAVKGRPASLPLSAPLQRTSLWLCLAGVHRSRLQTRCPPHTLPALLGFAWISCMGSCCAWNPYGSYWNSEGSIELVHTNLQDLIGFLWGITLFPIFSFPKNLLSSQAPPPTPSQSMATTDGCLESSHHLSTSQWQPS